VDIDSWKSDAVKRWPKRKKEIDAIGDMFEDREYQYDNTVLDTSRMKTLEFDLGLAVIWKHGSDIDRLIYHSSTKQVFDLNRKSQDNRLPRGSAQSIENSMKIVEGMLRGNDRMISDAIDTLNDGRRRKNFAAMNRAIERQNKKAGKRVYKRK